MDRLDAKQLLELHPWPEEWATAERIERLWVYDLPGSPAEFWPFLSDTSRLNRALGTSEMTFTERDGKRYGRSKPGGVEHTWEEIPWNWVANQWLTSLRVYETGFFRAVWAIHRLEPLPDNHTRLYLYYGTIPRNMIGAIATRVGFPSLERAYSRVLPMLAAELDQYRPAVLSIPPAPLSDAAAERLRKQRNMLVESGLSAECVDALIHWIQNGDDEDLHRIQIRERARFWKLPERDLLRVALHATRAGLLALSWDTVCPHCRGVRDENEVLSNLASKSHCEVCRIDFATDTEESVEVTFRVHPSIRDIPDVMYCSAEPAKKSHIRLQQLVRPGTEIKVNPQLDPGRYRARDTAGNSFYLDVDDDGETLVRWVRNAGSNLIKAQRIATLELVNESKEAQLFTVEQANWSDYALRARQLFGLHEFRDLFSEEYIGADVRLSVGEQTILFTDVVGSTAFYVTRGDPGAFVEIKRHFDEVFAIIVNFRGAVVKTIGDAVMATFGDPLDAVRAAEKICDTFPPSREDSPIRVRISINTGPCIAVKFNANIDFFGGTVNIAAKLQALAEGCQISMSDVTYNAPGVAQYLAERSADLESVGYCSRVFPDSIPAKRWTVHRSS